MIAVDGGINWTHYLDYDLTLDGKIIINRMFSLHDRRDYEEQQAIYWNNPDAPRFCINRDENAGMRDGWPIRIAIGVTLTPGVVTEKAAYYPLASGPISEYDIKS